MKHYIEFEVTSEEAASYVKASLTSTLMAAGITAFHFPEMVFTEQQFRDFISTLSDLGELWEDSDRGVAENVFNNFLKSQYAPSKEEREAIELLKKLGYAVKK